MKQKAQRLFRLSILLILFGFCQPLHLINFERNFQIFSSKLFSLTRISIPDFFLTRTNPVNFELSLLNGQPAEKLPTFRAAESDPNQNYKLLQNLVTSAGRLEKLIFHQFQVFLIAFGLILGTIAIAIQQKFSAKQMSGNPRDIQAKNYLRQVGKYPLKNLAELYPIISDSQILINSAGIIQFIGNNILDKLGYTPAELLDQNIKLILGNSDFLFNGKPGKELSGSKIKKTLKGKQGEKIIALLSWSFLRKRNQTQGVILWVTDITEHHQLQAAQRKEKKFYQLAETVPIATFIYQDKQFVYVNSAMETLTGYGKSTLLTMNC
jgi:PAS domain S-box-containing protein